MAFFASREKDRKENAEKDFPLITKKDIESITNMDIEQFCLRLELSETENPFLPK